MCLSFQGLFKMAFEKEARNSKNITSIPKGSSPPPAHQQAADKMAAVGNKMASSALPTQPAKTANAEKPPIQTKPLDLRVVRPETQKGLKFLVARARAKREMRKVSTVYSLKKCTALCCYLKT